MNCLYIDTSSSYLYAAILKNSNELFEIKQNFNHDLSKYTISEIDKLFSRANINKTDINKIIVVSGPGSFTGIRIGMTFAKIYAWCTNTDITTISSLEAMQSSIHSDNILVPIIDARRGYVYASVYKKGTEILKAQYIKLEDLVMYLNKLNEKYLFITNDQKFDFDNKVNYNPDFLNIILTYKDRKAINPHLIEPNYLKLTEAEENLGSIKNDN